MMAASVGSMAASSASSAALSGGMTFCAAAAARIAGVNGVLVCDDPIYEHQLVEPTAALLAEVVRGHPDTAAVVLTVRHELQVAAAEAHGARVGAEVVIEGELRDMVFLGPYVKYKVALDDGAEVIVNNSDLSLRQGLEVGSAVRVGWMLSGHRVIDAI